MRFIFGAALLLATAFGDEPPEYRKAVAEVQAGRWNDALDSLAPLLARYPDNAKVLNLKGLALAGAGRMGEARETLQRVLAIHPDFWPALKNLAIVEWQSGFADAATHTEAALKSAPEDRVLNAYGALASIARKDKRLTEGRVAKAGNALDALPVKLQYWLAVQLGENGLYPQSIAIFQKMLAVGADSPGLRYNLALAQFRAGHYSEAIETLKPLRLHGGNSDTLNLLALAYEKNGEKQQAADTFRQAIAADPSNEDNYLDLANLCVDAGLLNRAVEVVDAGLNVLPRSARLHFEAGLLKVLSRDFTGADTAFQRAASLQPESDLPAAAIELAQIEQAGLDEAIRQLRAELEVKPRSGMLWYLLGTALTRQGTTRGGKAQDEAVAAYRRAIEVDPKLAWPYVELAKIYLAQKRASEAARLLETAVRLDPQSRPAYYQLALAYRALHQPERSQRMFAKVRELNAREHGTSMQSDLDNER